MRGSVRKLSDGTWIADVQVNGRRRTGKAKTRAAALVRRRELLEELTARNVTSGGFTMREARELSMRVRWSGTAYERSVGIYSRQVVEYFGPDTQLGSITVPMVDAFRQAMLQTGNRPSTVNMKVSAIKAMMADAVLHGYLDQAPRMPQQLKVRNTRDRVISDAERDAFCRYFIQAGEPWAADLLLFLLDTCCRWSEAERLRGQDVDLGSGRVTFWHTKAGKPRSIRLTRKAEDAIRPYMPAVPNHRIWPQSYWRFRRLFDDAKAAMGLAGDDALTIHCTRHTCASKLASSGISLSVLMAYGGWASLRSVQRYLHLSLDAIDSCVAVLNE